LQTTADQRRSIDELQSDLWVTVERLALLSSGVVVRLAEEMYSEINQYAFELRTQATQMERLDASTTFMKKFFRARGELRTAMRQDLSVEKRT